MGKRDPVYGIIGTSELIPRFLGKGGVGTTYSAIDLETNSTVAIKSVSLRQLDDWKQVELFEREVKIGSCTVLVKPRKGDR